MRKLFIYPLVLMLSFSMSANAAHKPHKKIIRGEAFTNNLASFLTKPASTLAPEIELQGKINYSANMSNAELMPELNFDDTDPVTEENVAVTTSMQINQFLMAEYHVLQSYAERYHGNDMETLSHYTQQINYYSPKVVKALDQTYHQAKTVTHQLLSDLNEKRLALLQLKTALEQTLARKVGASTPNPHAISISDTPQRLIVKNDVKPVLPVSLLKTTSYTAWDKDQNYIG